MSDVYFARAIDHENLAEIIGRSIYVESLLAQKGHRMIDPFDPEEDNPAVDNLSDEEAARIVDRDAQILRKVDFLLLDMTIPDRNYCGCMVEMVYAHQLAIPIYFVYGDTRNHERVWVRYFIHSAYKTIEEAIKALPSS